MLGVIIVAYKNSQQTADYINNQLPKLNVPYVVVVVNNKSTFEECKTLASLCNGIACEPNDIIGKHHVYVVHSSDNLGFAKGNNLGVNFLSNNYLCEHILFSNNDIILPNSVNLLPMFRILDNNRNVGAIGPCVIGTDGLHQSPHRKIITAYRQIGWLLLPNLRKKRKTYNKSLISVPAEGICYWVSGAFFIMRLDIFSKINGFDPNTFLYSEEPILAERLKSIHMSMYFYPNLQITHLEGGCTKKQFSNIRLQKMIVDSNCIYYKNYLKTPTIVISLYRFLSYLNLYKFGCYKNSANQTSNYAE